LMQLEMFVAVVEERTMHRAAARVRRTQPAVTMAMKKLENEIGASLFARSTRHDLSLTEAGRILHGYAAQLIALRREAVTAMRLFRTTDPIEEVVSASAEAIMRTRRPRRILDDEESRCQTA
jgi:DNA-binding transcriptional LysR family regulator